MPAASAPEPPVDTRKAPRRPVEIHTLDDLRREIDAIERAARAGTARTTGNWEPGQMMWHIAEFWRASFDGFGFKAPLPLRMIFVPMKGMMLKQPKLPAGIKMRGEMMRFMPSESVTLEQGATALREQVARVHRGERMTYPSPLFGALTHEQWLKMHLSHAAHHFSFVRLQ